MTTPTTTTLTIDAHPTLGPAVAAIEKTEQEKLQAKISCNDGDEDSTVIVSNNSPKVRNALWTQRCCFPKTLAESLSSTVWCAAV